ncbi:MAG: T9SS type A sorting domain-containing protein [Bacteroidetes bacterium]|nr:T9SS type A sorting domain-containing protein [Bacteroidota bacterium]MBK9672685.1 T9SS type A sorting domain-containing protein [Bacteroidota bacterium]MBK9800295.1 T9SS type A sorting domain-containing protein [Bacteroidota bacterium]MBP6412453.1 T9SS type A sorting domain-containing protein [Bacteroidia bacterium]
MKRLFLISLLAYTFTSRSIAQNLILNGSFENITNCPWGVGQISFVPVWSSANSYLSPSLFNSCASLSSIVSVPVNIDSLLGYQNAHSGNGYAGINVYQDTNPFPIDYLQTQLTDSLDSGKFYCLTFYVSLSNISTWGVDAIGAYFAKQPSTVCSTFICVLTYTPQVSNPAGNILLDTLNWMKIEGCFQAQGGERYMIIGNFKDNANTQKAINKPGGYNWSTYYYVDDVSLYEDSTLILTENKAEEIILIFPNPANNFIQINSKSNQFPLAVEIYNLMGETILSQAICNESETIDISRFSNGLYFAKFLLNNNLSQTKKFTINH